jgi:hypothetical protein
LLDNRPRTSAWAEGLTWGSPWPVAPLTGNAGNPKGGVGPPRSVRWPVVLLNRQAERTALRRLLEATRAGHSGVLVLRGAPGGGKTVLLEEAIDSAAGFRVARTVGVVSVMELAFAALHQLCAPKPSTARRSTALVTVGYPVDSAAWFMPDRLRSACLRSGWGIPAVDHAVCATAILAGMPAHAIRLTCPIRPGR